MKLTSIGLFADEDDERSAQLRKDAMDKMKDLSRLSVYEKALAYETAMHLHRALTSSLVSKSERAIDSWQKESYYQVEKHERNSGLLAVHVIGEELPDGKSVWHLPIKNWELRSVYEIRGGDIASEIMIRKHALIRSELEKTVLAALTDEEKLACWPLHSVIVRADRSVYWPQEVIEYFWSNKIWGTNSSLNIGTDLLYEAEGYETNLLRRDAFSVPEMVVVPFHKAILVSTTHEQRAIVYYLFYYPTLRGRLV